MKRIELNRRDFSKLTIAAFGGVVAGTTIGCGGGDDSGKSADTKDADSSGAADTPSAGSGMADDTGSPNDAGAGDDKVADAESPLLTEPHVCRGMNACMNKGKSKENACAGQGTCHTLADTHTCHGENDCKGQGGCGETAGQNACDGKGECGVPLKKDTWETARAALKAALEKKGKELGAAPEA